MESLERRQLLAAEVLQITVENLSDENGLANTPVWIAAHDGNFDIGDSGVAASAFGGLELIAEDGDPGDLVARFAAEGVGDDGVIFAPAGFAGAPVFEAGEAVTENFTVTDTLASPYFSFASMIIPSNDAFIANLDAQAYRIFDVAGNFLGPQTIVIYGSQIYDAGTEVNDPAGGAAFATAGGTSTDENGVISLHTGLDDFVGAGLPTGETLGKAFGAQTPIARITISQASAPSSPLDDSAPVASLRAEDLTSRADSHEISVVYSDPSGIDINSISTDDLRITGPSLLPLEVVSVTTDAPAGSVPREVVATYQVRPTSGSFTHIDNGTYGVVLLEDQVNDPFAHATDAQLLGEFTVDAPVRLNVTFESLTETGGLYQTPVFIGAHSGNFEIARAGSPAADFGGLELIAEEGDSAELLARFQAETGNDGTVIFGPDGFAGAPVFDPGEVVTELLDVSNPIGNRYLSYASMIIPSNDAFIANLDPRAIELFDAFGNFTGARTITIYGQDIWDAGTEVNDPVGGAAFSAEGGTSIDENGVIRRHDGLDNFVGTGTPAGTLESAFGSMTPIGRFTISLADVPANAIDSKAPFANSDVAALDVTGQNIHEIRVTYSDASGVDLTSIGVEDIRVTGLFNESLEVVGVATDSVAGVTNPRTVTATYQVARPDGEEFTTFDNGLYAVELLEDQVSDSLGNEVSQQNLGNLEIFLPVVLTVTVENLSPEGGLTQTPFWVGVHEGNFELGRVGANAADFGGLEALAEDGDVAGVVTRFASESSGVDGVLLAPGGFAGAPVIEPGETTSQALSVFDTNENRYFSFASMLIPSNDAFFANFNPRQYELFDQDGFFNGEQTILLTGRDVWDAGTEVNGIGAGAPFSTLGGTGVDENGVIHRHEGLDEFIGTGLPTGESLQSAFNPETPLVRITIGLAGGNVQPEDSGGPTVVASASEVTVAGQTSHEIQVVYNDPAGIDPTSIDTGDLLIAGPLGRPLTVTGVTTDATPGTTPNTVTATYTVTTGDGQFTGRDNGRYTIAVAPGEVVDTLGKGASTAIAGDFNVDVGVRVQIEVESLTEVGGLAGTPFWVGFHDGSFELARGGASASEFGGLELIAEEGDPSEIVARFAAESDGTDTVITAPDGFAGAPVFEPGEIAAQVLEIENARDNRYFSFISMVIPSNDAFVANRDAQRYELFDRFGNFNGARQITIYGRDILDAGTEVNDPLGGAAFSTEGGTSADEGGLITSHTGLDEFIGTGTPTGTLQSAFGDLTPIATITISLFDPEADVCSGVDGACSARSVSLQNSALSSDVNRDGRVSALDSLLVINFVNQFGNLPTISDEAQATGLSLDVGGDEAVSSLDALQVINEIGRLFNSPQAEGELVETVDAVFGRLEGEGFLDVEDDEFFFEVNESELF